MSVEAGDASRAGDGGARPDGGGPLDAALGSDAAASDGGEACTDECPRAGATACTGQSAYHLCGEFDGDGCLEWGEIVQCPSGCANGKCAGCDVQCAGRECGDDGCGGSCGSCQKTPDPSCTDARTLRTWNPDGSCTNGACSYSYSDKECPYGCGNGRCQGCTPDCAGKQCGDDGCGEPCGQCASPPATACLDASTLREYDRTGTCGAGACSYPPHDRACPHGCAGAQCANCTADCAGKTCGSDGCGGDCGTCGANSSCAGGRCECFPGFADCNGGSDGCETDTRSDGANCGGCGAPCGDHASCRGSACLCDDDRASCDGTFANGCERTVGDAAGNCLSAQDIGGVCGDSGADRLGPISGHDATWLKVRVRECSNWDTDLSVYATLSSPADADFDLAFSRACGAAPKGTSTLGPGATDALHDYESDSWGSTDDFDLYIEVRYKAGSGTGSCGDWTLNVYGNR